MNARERFLAACRCEAVDRPPVWIMRQAGRYLPEYRRLREDHSFHDVVETPELAREVTLQPMRRFDLDAAILFCDILVIPEAMGQHYGFPEGGGIEMEFAVRDREALRRLDPTGVADRLSHVGDALELVAEALDGRRALIGFGGAPWTLATYMIEGESRDHKDAAKELFYQQRDLFDDLLESITEALVDYFEMQIRAGADALQIFDSWAGELTPRTFEEAALPWIRRLVAEIDGRVPVIVFAKGMSHLLEPLASTGADVLSLDSSVDLAEARAALPEDVAVQGNLDPALPALEPDVVERETRRLLESLRGARGHILNLGHGIRPNARPESVARLVETTVALGDR